MCLCVYDAHNHAPSLSLSLSHTHTHTLLHITHTQTHMPAGAVAGGWTGSFSTSAKDAIAGVSVVGALLVRMNMLRAKWFPSFFMLPRNTLDIFNVCMFAATAHKWENRRTDCAWDSDMPLTIQSTRWHIMKSILSFVVDNDWGQVVWEKVGHNIW